MNRLPHTRKYLVSKTNANVSLSICAYFHLRIVNVWKTKAIGFSDLFCNPWNKIAPMLLKLGIIYNNPWSVL